MRCRSGWPRSSGTRHRSSCRRRRWRTRLRFGLTRRPVRRSSRRSGRTSWSTRWAAPRSTAVSSCTRSRASGVASHLRRSAAHELGEGGVVVLENTHRSSGGSVWPLDEFRASVDAAHERGARLHLDGARLFNAAVGAGLAPRAWAEHADSVTICFSKGLGCPLGAVVAGSHAFIERAWESKYLFGGAMRQSGVLAAAALYAVENHVERLGEDHERARRLASAIGADEPETNFVVMPDPGDGIARLREWGVLVSDLRPGVLRAMTYLGVSDDDVDRAGEIIPAVIGARVNA